MSEPITNFAERFTDMKLKDEPILVYNGALDVDIDTVFKQLHCLDPELKMDKLTKEVLSIEVVFIEHSCSTNYSFRLKKCSSLSCYYCSVNSPRLPPDIFKSLSWLPMPLLDSLQEPFKSVYGKGVNQPSLRGATDDAAIAID